jgi:NADH-quinone oxidoreductase subunit J
VAIIAAIALTLRRRKDSRQLDVSEQLRARKVDRVRLVKIPPVLRDAPSDAPKPVGDRR